jgi:eukaryotic-like serine/threonine-protein kinase
VGDLASEVHALTLKGRERVVTSLAGEFVLHDLAGDGRMLVERVFRGSEMAGFSSGEAGERSLSWLDQSVAIALSADNQMLLFADRGDTAGKSTAAYLRKTDGSAAVRLGAGSPLDLSPDGKWALALRTKPNPHLVLLPTGVGQERPLSTGPVVVEDGAGLWAGFHPNGKRIFFGGVEPGHRVRAYEQSLESGSPKPVTPEGMRPSLLSPDGALLLAGVDGDRNVTIFPTDAKAGTAPHTVTLLSAQEAPVHWSADGRSLLIVDVSTRPIRVDRLDLSSGRRTLWRSFSPRGLLGGGGLSGFAFSANEQEGVVGYGRYYSELLVIDGLK